MLKHNGMAAIKKKFATNYHHLHSRNYTLHALFFFKDYFLETERQNKTKHYCVTVHVTCS